MAKTNKSKEKDPVLKEIEGDDTPIDPKTGQPIVAPPEMNVTDLLAKNAGDLSAAEMDFLSQHKEDLTPEQLVQVGLADPEPEPSHPAPEPEPPAPPTPEPPAPVTPPAPVVPAPVVPAPVVPIPAPQATVEPTDEDLRAYLAKDGVDMDELTAFEKSTAKKNYIFEKKQAAIDESLQSQKKQSEWVGKIDTFLGSRNNDPKYAGLDGHEAEFKAFAMQHPESDIEGLLLPAFLHNLPPANPNRGSLFQKGGGGQPPAKPKTEIDDAEMVKNLREKDPREYKRLLKAKKIKLEVD